MTNSRDFSSPTYDFMIGRGADLPEPTCEDLAHLIFAVADRLWHKHVLEDFVGEHRALSNCNNQLRSAITTLLPDQVGEFEHAHARLIYDTYRSEYTTTQLYLTFGIKTTTRVRGPLWYLVQFRSNAEIDDGYVTCKELQDASMLAELLSQYEWGRGMAFGVLDCLDDLLRDDIKQRQGAA